jgi:hypothetical protein
MLSALGTFWEQQFAGNQVLLSMLLARQVLYEDTYGDYLDAVDCLSQFEVPVSDSLTWYPFVVSQAAMEIVPVLPLTYGPNQAQYGEPGDIPPYNRNFEYGDGLSDDVYYRFPLPEGLLGLHIIANSIINSSTTLVEDIDFVVDIQAGTLTL